MKQRIVLMLVFVLSLTACSGGSDMGGMMPGGGMMERHHTSIPDEYAGQTNPMAADEESLARGEEIYTTNCASCHGDGGVGDGPAGAALDPAPSNIAHTSQMLGDDYLFWRISEGGAMEPFSSSMPSWKATFDPEARWDVLNYIQALGSGEVMPESMMGGATFDPEAKVEERAEMLAEAVEQGLITQEEADIFNEVHAAMDELMADGGVDVTGGMAARQAAMLAELVSSEKISQTQADAFNDIHDRLIEAGVMQ